MTDNGLNFRLRLMVKPDDGPPPGRCVRGKSQSECRESRGNLLQVFSACQQNFFREARVAPRGSEGLEQDRKRR